MRQIEESCQDDEVVTEQLQEHDTLGSDDSLERNPCPIVRPFEFKRPSGFKELCSLLDKFTGKSGEGDFEAWLEDYMEATQARGWKSEQKFHWFSWLSI